MAKRAVLHTTVVLLLRCIALGEPGASTLKTATPPAWVEPSVSPGIPSKPGRDSIGQIFTLFDTQVNVAEAETFCHIIKEITSETGVQNGANLTFSWDPSFQELILHQITIHRADERMDRLDLAKFKIIQQETDLSRQVYNGALSALLFLDDVRVGDQIEYAFTLRGENPALKGRYSDTFFVGLAVPVEQRRIRVLFPAGRRLNFRLYGTTAQPEILTQGGIREYKWDLHDAPAVIVEDQSPTWIPPYPWIQISGFTNWAEVANWAAALFATTNLDALEIRDQIAKLQRKRPKEEQALQAALEFVQNDIRYLGIEFGPNSYRPTDPVTVLRRRFGDCKDKTFLLCTLLRGLGYDATPVLVATGFRHTLPDLLPAPQDFDHVIVRVINKGAALWLDPTRPYQHGSITQRFVPLYSFGLPAVPGEPGLFHIPACSNGAPATFTSEVFRVGRQKAATQLSVRTTFKGVDAEWMRAVLASGGRERLEKSYLNDYAQRYPGVTLSAPIAVEDSPDSDTLSFSHTYSITNFWKLTSDKERYTCQFYPLGIHSWIIKPATAIRSMPMEISFPRRRTVQTKIELPRVFKLSNATNFIVGPASELRVQRAYRGQTLWLNYEYRALTNFVPVSLTAKHLDSLDQMENVLGYSLTWQNMETVAARSQFNWPIFLVATLYATMLLVCAGLLYRHQLRLAPVAVPPALPGERLNGLGGWLVLVAIGLIGGPLVLLVNMGRNLGSFSLWRWQTLTSPGGASYHPAWGPLLTIELLGQLTILMLAVFVAILFFQKRRIFPRWFIALVLVNAIFTLGDSLAVQLVRTSSPAASAAMARNFIRVFVGCGIWIPYMFLSRRVKETFVR